jgi:hypothetical protein
MQMNTNIVFKLKIPNSKSHPGNSDRMKILSSVLPKNAVSLIYFQLTASALERFLFSKVSSLYVGPTHLPTEWAPEVKRPGREADFLSPFGAKAKNEWN